MPLSLDDLRHAIGFGVAGNFTGHLEQAGEASDFVHVTAAAGAPKGVFPFYVPHATASADHFLHTFPLSHQVLRHPGQAVPDGNLQIEPEVALLCELAYGPVDAAGQRPVTAITPTHFGAYNDCSIRRPHAPKISHKKNWGPDTKGLAWDQLLPLDRFDATGELSHYRLASYLQRAGQLLTYGEDSPISGYGYIYGQLIHWLIDRLNHQTDHGPLEHLATWLRLAGHPNRAIFAIGATRYTALGETTFLEPGDRAIVAVYDARRWSVASLEEAIGQPATRREGLSLLMQDVVTD